MSKKQQIEVIKKTIRQVFETAKALYETSNELKYVERITDYLAGIYHVAMNLDLTTKQLSDIQNYYEEYQKKAFEIIHEETLKKYNAKEL